MFFSSTKSKNKRVEQVLTRGGGEEVPKQLFASMCWKNVFFHINYLKIKIHISSNFKSNSR
jgi:hypothetical protein